MAEKRMFTQKIIDSDAFLEMPLSAQALYFHLNMRADDDGFVNNPKRVTKLVCASEDDLKILLLKRFIIGFESGVIVIKHWRMHNTLKSDRYHPTDYQEEFAMLGIKPNKAYTDHPEKLLQSGPGTEVEPEWNQNGTRLEPENREGLGLDKDLDLEEGKEIKISDSTKSSEITNQFSTNTDVLVCRTKDVRRITQAWNSLGLQQLTKVTGESKRGSMLRARVNEYGTEAVLAAIEKIRSSSFLKGQNKDNWVITFEWFVRPNNFVKILEGNYDDRKSFEAKPESPKPAKGHDDLDRLAKMYVEKGEKEK